MFSFLACRHVTDDVAEDLSIVFLLSASDTIDDSDFANVKFATANAAVFLTEIGARVGVVVFSDNATVQVPLQYWESTGQLYEIIQEIPYIGGVTNTHIGLNVTASLLGNEGTRVIVLVTGDMSHNVLAAQREAEAAKQAGISIYVAGIGNSVNENELNSLASYPPEDYRVSTTNLTVTALNEEVQSLIASTCLSKPLYFTFVSDSYHGVDYQVNSLLHSYNNAIPYN